MFLSNSHPPTHPLPHTLQANWESPLADLPSYSESSSWQHSLAHYPQQGSALLEPQPPHRTWLTSQQTLSPCCHGNHNLATTTWQCPTPRGIDWVSNAVRGGLGRVLLSPWVKRNTQGLIFGRNREDGGLTGTMMTALARNWSNTKIKEVSDVFIAH